MKKNKITKKNTFAEALGIKPHCAPILFKYGLHCVGCHLAADETIEQGAKAHGLNEEEIKRMIYEINSTE